MPSAVTLAQGRHAEDIPNEFEVAAPYGVVTFEAEWPHLTVSVDGNMYAIAGSSASKMLGRGIANAFPLAVSAEQPFFRETLILAVTAARNDTSAIFSFSTVVGTRLCRSFVGTAKWQGSGPRQDKLLEIVVLPCPEERANRLLLEGGDEARHDTVLRHPVRETSLEPFVYSSVQGVMQQVTAPRGRSQHGDASEQVQGVDLDVTEDEMTGAEDLAGFLGFKGEAGADIAKTRAGQTRGDQSGGSQNSSEGRAGSAAVDDEGGEKRQAPVPDEELHEMGLTRQQLESIRMQRRPSSSGDADSEHSSGSSRGARGSEAGPSLECLGAALPGDASPELGRARLVEEETVDDKDARSAEADNF